MLVYEFKVKGNSYQYQAVDEAIRIGQFIRNKCLRYWMDASKQERVNRSALSRYTKVLSDDSSFPFVSKLNSMARQASSERAWLAISRFYDHCKKKGSGKKGFPQFKKISRSVEYKTSGWKLSDNRSYITFTDQTGIGTLKLYGSREIHFFQKSDIKRVRLIRRADGYYTQFCLDLNRVEDCTPIGQSIGLDVGLESFYTDSNGSKVENPRFLRKAEKKLKRFQRSLSKKKRGSNNKRKAQAKLARQHLKVSRKRKDWVVKLAQCVAKSNDFVAIENLNVKGLTRTRLAKSISDASWSMFRQWLEYFCSLYKRELVAVNPSYTSQDCSGCGKRVKKSLSTRTHICQCGCKLDRDHNAGINILRKGKEAVGHTDSKNASGRTDLCYVSESLQSKLAG